MPQDATVIDAKGKPVTPGLMASYTQLGIEEVEMVNETNDSAGRPGRRQRRLRRRRRDQSQFDADPDRAHRRRDALADRAGHGPRRVLRPGGCHRSGSSARTWSTSATPPSSSRSDPWAPISDRGTRPDTWAQFREVLDDAREYWADRSGYHKPGGSRDQRSARIDLDALGPVIRGEEPLLVHAERASDIRQAVRYATANHLKIVILGAEEGWMAARDLADAHVPVIIDTQHNLPSTFSDIGATLRNAARMDAAGVTVTFMPESIDPAQYARTIAQVAGNAVPYGMPWEHALAAITKNPAEVWGIADRYGTLEPGKDADVVIWDGDPLEVTSAPTAVFIKGARIPMVSRQTMLRDRYRHLDKKGLPFAYR